MEHGMECFRDLVCLLLGDGAVAQAKCECGSSLCVLGIDVEPSRTGYTLKPSAAKVAIWRQSIARALDREELLPHEADKLSGRLSWACSRMFRRVGRAMLRPLYDQKTRWDGSMSPELRRSLVWWDEVLGAGIAEVREWGR